MLATDLAEYLVRKGVPFRETHHVAGAAVRMAEMQAVPLSELTLDDLLSLHDAFEEDVADVWDFERSVERRAAIGGTSRQAVAGADFRVAYLVGERDHRAGKAIRDTECRDDESVVSPKWKFV